ncbi:MAG: ferrous iron transport protein A [Flavobacteriales bacterium]|nr:ferrous iron transport protein A [Flavobacteriales bacterium]MBK7242000.1 ferrous iron transport protein A [Flavobacteriales bacterium]
MNAPSITAIRLNELPAYRWANVVEVIMPTTDVDRDLVLRLVELGFVPEERVRVVATGAAGYEPLAVRLGGTTFALRRHEASFILVTLEP